MSYKNPEDQKRKVYELYHERRDAFFHGKVCDTCGTSENLALHHPDKTTKVGPSTNIWLMRESKRTAELAKCVVRCNSCHAAHHNRERTGWKLRRRRIER